MFGKVFGFGHYTVEAAYCGHLGPGTSVRIIRLSRISGIHCTRNTDFRPCPGVRNIRLSALFVSAIRGFHCIKRAGAAHDSCSKTLRSTKDFTSYTRPRLTFTYDIFYSFIKSIQTLETTLIVLFIIATRPSGCTNGTK